jgi:GAF domain-containing protein
MTEGLGVANIDSGGLQAALDKLADLSVERDVESTLHDVTEAVSTLFTVKGTGLMFLDSSDALRYVVSSDKGSEVLELAQERLGAGPCVDCLLLDTPIATNDLASDERWPGLASEVVPHGVRAVLGVPVRLGPGAVGSLDAYYDAPHSWDASEIDALGKFGAIVEGVLGNALLAHRRGRVVDQLQYALDNRVVIERAIGLVMGRAGNVDAVAAFNRLREVARSQRRRVGEVAADVLSGTLDV